MFNLLPNEILRKIINYIDNNKTLKIFINSHMCISSLKYNSQLLSLMLLDELCLDFKDLKNLIINYNYKLIDYLKDLNDIINIRIFNIRRNLRSKIMYVKKRNISYNISRLNKIISIKINQIDRKFFENNFFCKNLTIHETYRINPMLYNRLKKNNIPNLNGRQCLALIY